jgi:hypothetical protein
MEQLNALEALKDPAHGGASCRFVDVIGNGLLGLGQARPQPKLGQTRDQQAQDHDQAQRHDPFGLFHEHGGRQKQGVFEKAKAALDAALFFVRSGSRLTSKLLRREDVGATNPARFAQRLLLDHFLVDGHAGHNVPLVGERTGILAGPSSPFVVRMSHQVTLHIQPGGLALLLAFQSGSRIGFTRKPTIP